MGHWALGIEKRQARRRRGGRQGRDLFNNSPLSSSSPPLPTPLSFRVMSLVADRETYTYQNHSH